jgi:uncharacterized repeat protein (TIGR03803 family)
MAKARGRPFPTGNAAGSGRPTGSRNKTTQAAQGLLSEYAEPVTKKCLTMAMHGDSAAMRLVMERILPARRSAPLQFKLPKMKLSDIPKGAQAILTPCPSHHTLWRRGVRNQRQRRRVQAECGWPGNRTVYLFGRPGRQVAFRRCDPRFGRQPLRDDHGGRPSGSPCDQGCGVVYKLDPGGQQTVLYSFTGEADGDSPDAGVIRDSAGNLYGTTIYGGTGSGVVYKLNTSGQETVLHTFTGGADGMWPSAGVIEDSAGNLYGTTQRGGSTGYGVVYKLDTAGHQTVLYSFKG